MEDGSALSLLTPYPINSIYMAETETSPASIFGGEWERIEKRFLLGHGSGNTLGQTGGEEKHKLITSEMPRHNHVGSDNGYAFLVDINKHEVSNEFAMLTSSSSTYKYSVSNGTGFTGGTQPHNNMPPYYVVNIWKRVA